ncbi:MAG: hypothetical protein IBX63_10580 [Coriobacteriia bacterium]|nr:hypothetical protein [Coriobacteriia bacterium]
MRAYFMRLVFLFAGVALVVVVALLLATIAPDTAGPFGVVAVLLAIVSLPLLAALPALWGPRYDIGYAATAGVALLVAVAVATVSSFQFVGYSSIALKLTYVSSAAVATVLLHGLTRHVARRRQAGVTDSGGR